MLFWSIQAASTWALIGLIWTIQLVHYPLFSVVGDESFTEYAKGHASRITLIVAPLMLLELVSSPGCGSSLREPTRHLDYVYWALSGRAPHFSSFQFTVD